MMEKLRIYLDTSVISAYFDLNKPVRQIITEKWFENDLVEYDSFISNLVIDEINNNSNSVIKDKMLNLISDKKINILTIKKEILDLSGRYRQEILTNEINDSFI